MRRSKISEIPKHDIHTVDGRNPASPGMVKTPTNNGIIIILGGAGFQPSTVGSMYDLFASPLGMGATEFFLRVFLANLSAAF